MGVLHNSLDMTSDIRLTQKKSRALSLETGQTGQDCAQDTTIHSPCRTFHHFPMPQNLPSESTWGLHVPEHHGFGLLFPRAVTHGFSPIGQGGTRGFLGTEHGAGHGATSVGSRMRVVPHLFGRISGRWYEWHLVLISWGKNGLIWCGQLEW